MEAPKGLEAWLLAQPRSLQALGFVVRYAIGEPLRLVLRGFAWVLGALLVASGILFVGLVLGKCGAGGYEPVYQEQLTRPEIAWTVDPSSGEMKPRVLPPQWKTEFSRNGQRCATIVHIAPGTSEARCVDGFGRSVARTPSKQSITASCCISMVPHSEDEWNAWLRRLSPEGLTLRSSHIFITFALALTALALVALLLLTVAAGFARALYILVRANRGPMLTPGANDPPRLPRGAIVAIQITDTHVTCLEHPYEVYADPHQCADKPIRREEVLSRLQRLFDLASRIDAPYVILTGDIVDTGAADEWSEVKAALRSRAQLAQRIEYIPGNHDVSMSLGRTPDLFLGQRGERVRRFAEVAGDEPYPRFRRVCVAGREALIVMLDSTQYRSRYLVSNAVGLVGRRQRAVLEAYLSDKDVPLLVFVHHHIAKHPRIAGVAAIMELYGTVIDARALVRLLLAYQRRTRKPVQIGYGHQHCRVRGMLTGREACLQVFGAGSSTLGSKVRSSKGVWQLDDLPNLCVYYLGDDGWDVEERPLSKESSAEHA